MACHCRASEQGLTLDERNRSERWLNDALQKAAQAAAVEAGHRQGPAAESFAATARTLAEAIEVVQRLHAQRA